MACELDDLVKKTSRNGSTTEAPFHKFIFFLVFFCTFSGKNVVSFVIFAHQHNLFYLFYLLPFVKHQRAKEFGCLLCWMSKGSHKTIKTLQTINDHGIITTPTGSSISHVTGVVKMVDLVVRFNSSKSCHMVSFIQWNNHVSFWMNINYGKKTNFCTYFQDDGLLLSPQENRVMTW